MAARSITFVVPGQERSIGRSRERGAAHADSTPTAPADLNSGTIKTSIVVGAQRSAGASVVRATAVVGKDIVQIHISGGPTLTLHPETARDLFLAQQATVKVARGERGAPLPGPDEVNVPAELRWQGLEQVASVRGRPEGLLGKVVIEGLDVVTDLAVDAAADFATSKVVQACDGQVTEGVYQLTADTLTSLKGTATATTIKPPTPGAPLLVLIHGTFSTTTGTFGKLWRLHPQHVRAMFDYYHGAIFALDHRTLGASPIDNALTLVRALPKDAIVHLLTHSRGGLVAEVLARACAGVDEDLSPFEAKDHADEHKALTALIREAKKKNIRVKRVVRVACPARGTLLASNRLDAYLSAFKWTLQLAGIPVAPVLVDFLAAVAQQRKDPNELPGLAAQMPDSPLVQWLHRTPQPLDSELRVVAGDVAADSVASWFKTLVADAFYWTDNDFVVQTRSMYGGSPRAEGATFVLDQGGSVSHFNYFTNDRTAEAIANALTQGSPAGFRRIGPLSLAGESSTGVRAGASLQANSDKPAVFLLPGIAGSNLKVDGQRLWVNWRFAGHLDDLAYSTAKADGVEPDGPVGSFYNALHDFLSHTHEVIEFAFDWRRPLEDTIPDFAKAVSAALDARAKTNQPVRMIAHSMGGMVARVLQLEKPDVWNRMMAHPRARVVMLGTPNGGSWAPMQVASGDDTLGNVITAFGAPFQGPRARTLMANFPGLMQLQAGLLDDAKKIGDPKEWERLAKEDFDLASAQAWWHHLTLQKDDAKWGLPSKATLDRAVALRKRLDEQQRDGRVFADKVVLVVGAAPFTPDGYAFQDKGLVYLDAPDEGDGTVTFDSARLPGVRTWKFEAPHGSLPAKRDAFEGYLELLEKGTTSLFKNVTDARPSAAAATRSGAGGGVSAGLSPVRVASRPSRAVQSARVPREEDVMTSADELTVSTAAESGAALKITVVNGDLTFVRQPVLLGHYRASRLTGTEWVMNELVGRAMADSLNLDLYPDEPGTHQIFVNRNVNPKNPWQLPRPQAVIVVGLGDEGKLRANELAMTVRQAVIAWSQRAVEQPSAPASFDLAATLLGSGGLGISVAEAAQLIAQGVRDANERLSELTSGQRWPIVGHLSLIELYLDRASEAWRALRVQANATPGRYVVTETVQAGSGGLRRPLDGGYRGADYDFVRAESKKGRRGERLIAYTLDTRRARSEVNEQATQKALIADFVAKASNNRNTDPAIGRTLFQLLVPLALEPFFGGTSDLVIELDGGTAGIPWELLDNSAAGGRDPRPWAIRTKLLRKLRTVDFRARVVDADADAHVLVIGEPSANPAKNYPRLSGARREARAVVKRLTEPDGLPADRVKALIAPDDEQQAGPDSAEVLNALLSRDWRIVHIAGHGEPPERIVKLRPGCADPIVKIGDPCGVVLSNGFLGPREIANMRVVPELVFVNCCHLAARMPEELLTDRVKFAAGVAEALIQIGVRCVVAAGWAVDDEAASVFAATFYESLLQGRSFITAVAEARTLAFSTSRNNTWAAYQCYGDPDWTFRREGGDAQRPNAASPGAEFSSVASAPALSSALNTIAVRAQSESIREATKLELRTKLMHLEGRFASVWGAQGDVAQAFGRAWTEVGDRARGIGWYEKAVRANNGGASLRAAEQLGNLRVRRAWDGMEAALRIRDDAEQALALIKGRSPGTPKDRAAAIKALDRARREVERRARESRKEVLAALPLLTQLLSISPTVERESLCGSAHKRLALIATAAGRGADRRRAIASMREHYEKAEHLARETDDVTIFYPAMQRISADVAQPIKGRRVPLDQAAVAAVRQSLASKVRDDPDFWSVIGLTELTMLEALAAGQLAARRGEIASEFEDAYGRITSSNLWSSVRDNAAFVFQDRTGLSPAESKAASDLLARLTRYAMPVEGPQKDKPRAAPRAKAARKNPRARRREPRPDL